MLSDAERLEKLGFSSSAILLYCHYLEQFLLISTLSYSEKHYIVLTHSIREDIFDIKDAKNLTFGKILQFLPPQIKDDEIIQLCNEVKNIRNVLGAHPYFVIPLDKTRVRGRRIEDVNSYRKFIRRLYRLIRKINQFPEVEIFLNGKHPLTAYRTLEIDAYNVESLLMKYICIHTKKLVLDTVNKIETSLKNSSHDPNLEKFIV